MKGHWSVAQWLIDERDVDWVGQSVLCDAYRYPLLIGG
jgi:hypothetical protein